MQFTGMGEVGGGTTFLRNNGGGGGFVVGVG